jgi:hypothetical protein
MGRRVVGAVVIAVAIAAAGISRTSIVRAAAVCDGSAYDTLCAGGHLNTNGYLMSPNGRYRFMYQPDGNTLIYDTQDWNNWNPSAPILYPHANANYMMYGVGGSGRATTQVTLWSFNHSNTSALPYFIDWGPTRTANHYMRLENDGCLRVYEEDDSFIMTLWC